MSAVDSLAGIIPIVIVGGLAMKLTDKMMGNQKPLYRNRRQRPSNGMGRNRRRRSVGFGNFSNIGM